MKIIRAPGEIQTFVELEDVSNMDACKAAQLRKEELSALVDILAGVYADCSLSLEVRRSQVQSAVKDAITIKTEYTQTIRQRVFKIDKMLSIISRELPHLNFTDVSISKALFKRMRPKIELVREALTVLYEAGDVEMA